MNNDHKPAMFDLDQKVAFKRLLNHFIGRICLIRYKVEQKQWDYRVDGYDSWVEEWELERLPR